MRYFHIFTVLGAIIGGFELLSVAGTTGISAPQQAAGAAMAVAWVVIPYCFARAIVEMAGAEEAQLKRANGIAETQTCVLREIVNAHTATKRQDVSGG